MVGPKIRGMAAEDLLTTLLERSDDKKSAELADEMEIKRGGKVRLVFHVHQIDNEDMRKAQKSSISDKKQKVKKVNIYITITC